MRFLACAASQLETAVRLYAPDAVVSLASPGAAVSDVPLPPAGRLVLRFNDIVLARPGLTTPSLSHVRALLDFKEVVAAARGPHACILVHCFAAVSRSPAAVYILACADAPGAEARLAGLMRLRSPECTPNQRMIALGDEALDRGGAMVRAIDALARGREAFEGPTFGLP